MFITLLGLASYIMQPKLKLIELKLNTIGQNFQLVKPPEYACKTLLSSEISKKDAAAIIRSIAEHDMLYDSALLKESSRLLNSPHIENLIQEIGVVSNNITGLVEWPGVSGGRGNNNSIAPNSGPLALTYPT